jgi:hypothetical protein
MIQEGTQIEYLACGIRLIIRVMYGLGNWEEELLKSGKALVIILSVLAECAFIFLILQSTVNEIECVINEVCKFRYIHRIRIYT